MTSRLAVLIPCHNEALTIGRVVEDFQRSCPEAEIWVCDNRSRDGSSEIAAAAGARVIHEARLGKGYAVRRLFAVVEADVYVLVDGDGTYPAERVRELTEPVLQQGYDMVVGSRLMPGRAVGGRFRPGHVLGNRLVTGSINLIFDGDLTDVMSGYRALSRRLVKNLPLVSRGFEIETQLSILALYYQFSCRELPVVMSERPRDSFSKLRTLPDGFRACLAVFNACKAYRPLPFYGLLAILSGLVWAWLRQPFWPALSVIFLVSGLILDTANHRFRELGLLVIQRSLPAGGG